MSERVLNFTVILFWISVILIYPMMISIYVTLPLFIGFSGLMLVIGIDDDKYVYSLFSLIYMFNLELNLSLPLLLAPISVVIFYILIKNRLHFLKLCKKCVYIATIIFINLIYFILLAGYDFINSQDSINYNSLIVYSLIYDIILSVII